MNDESRKFFETVRDYLLIYMAKQRVMSRNTIASYKQAINQYLSFLAENKSIKYEAICFRDWSAANINEYLLYLENERNIALHHKEPKAVCDQGIHEICQDGKSEIRVCVTGGTVDRKRHGGRRTGGIS
ncbi:MAG: site-specific integrase [Lachnospiraceae bacterium]|nr:site-specific integrase [Lachnospiraceae bacterium]